MRKHSTSRRLFIWIGGLCRGCLGAGIRAIDLLRILARESGAVAQRLHRRCHYGHRRPEAAPQLSGYCDLPHRYGHRHRCLSRIGSTNNVWNNDTVDGSFGVTSPIFLDQITTDGTRSTRFAVPTNMLITSFSSKSELALEVIAGRNRADLHGLRGAPQHSRRLEFQYARRRTIRLIPSAAATIGQSPRSTRTAQSR